MKKIIIVFAIALFASFTYAAVSTIASNDVAVEKFDDKPKKKTEKKTECSKEKKACCSKKQKASCGGK